jgi:hypothetical protein
MYSGGSMYEDASTYTDPSGNILPRFNLINTQWVVPAKPLTPDAVNAEVLWTGFQSAAGIIQPETWYYGSSNQWTAMVQYGPPSGNWTNSSSFNVSPGDTIVGWAEIQAAETGTEGETWGTGVTDSTTGASQYFHVTIPHGTYFGGTASGNPGVLEVQGLSACTGLPDTSTGEQFNLVYLSQESANGGWNVYNDVRGLVQYTSDWLPGGTKKICSRSANEVTNSDPTSYTVDVIWTGVN